MEKEIWKDVVWYEWIYQISNLGRVKSILYSKERILKKYDKDWYSRLTLVLNKNKITKKIHRLVALAFIPNPENKPHINHINWIKGDNRVENLEWCTRSENELHKYKVLWYDNWMQKTWWPSKWKFWKDNHLGKKINQYTKEWEFIKTWWSIIDIERQMNILSRSIINVCKWKYWFKTAWWFIWEYAES